MDLVVGGKDRCAISFRTSRVVQEFAKQVEEAELAELAEDKAT